MSDTWVAVDGSDPTGFSSTTCWICDCGPYIGPVPAVLAAGGPWVPADVYQLDWFIALPKPGGDPTHVADGTYSTSTYYQFYRRDRSGELGLPSSIDSGAHLFAIWYDPAFPDLPADLATPSASPLDMVPAALVSGGRLSLAAVGVFTMPIRMPALRVVDAHLGVLTMPITMPTVAPVTAGATVSFGVFEMPIDMPPLFLQVAGPDDPPADWSDLGPPDPVYSEDGTA